MIEKNKLVVDFIKLTELDGTAGEAIDTASDFIKENGDINKFTGYYVQRQIQKDILVLMYGYDASNRNGISKKITLHENEVDYVEICMRLYLLSIRKRDRAEPVSFIERRNRLKEKW